MTAFLAPMSAARPGAMRGDEPTSGRLIERVYFDADSAFPSAAWPAASRAVGTRNGEQDT